MEHFIEFYRAICLLMIVFIKYVGYCVCKRVTVFLNMLLSYNLADIGHPYLHITCFMFAKYLLFINLNFSHVNDV